MEQEIRALRLMLCRSERYLMINSEIPEINL